MRSAPVVTHLRCNQNCRYCNQRSATDDPAFVRVDAVRARVDRAVRDGSAEIVLTGGEPTLRRDLHAIVGHVLARGAAPVLETNARVVDDALAARLAAAGLSKARVNLSGATPALDDVTRDPGGWDATRAGIEALRRAGIPIEIRAAVVRSTRPLLAELPALVASLGELPTEIGGIELVHPVEAPDPSELLTYPDATEAIVDVEAAARPLALPVRLSPDALPPPCVFSTRRRPDHLFSLTRGGAERSTHRRVDDVCDHCSVKGQCPGVPRAYITRFGIPEMRPIEGDRARRRLSLIQSVDEQIRRELVSPSVRRDADGSLVREEIIRINFHCNQACRFCFVSTHLPAPSHETVVSAIDRAAVSGARIILSGGEPTLNPRLAEYVALARRLSGHPVGLQTNAVRLADEDTTRTLVRAGVGEAFVSLHGSNSEMSDAVTEAPGTFDKTVLGLDHLHGHVDALILNFVICGRNHADLPAFVRFVAGRWPRAFVTLSFVAPSTDVVPRDRDLIPRYADVMPSLSAALAEAKRLEVAVGGFESMCGIPLCQVPAALSGYLEYAPIPEGFDAGELLKTETCARCDLQNRCFGLRRGYAELYGTDELRAVRLDSHR